MIRLVADTSPTGFRLGFFKDEKCLWQEHLIKAKGEQATDLVQKGLDLVALEASDVEEVLLTNGPGSFTGIRTLISFFAGFCYGTGAVLKMSSSLRMRALLVEGVSDVCVVMNAGAGGCYVGQGQPSLDEWTERRYEMEELITLKSPVVAFEKVLSLLGGPCLQTLEDLEKDLLVGFVRLASYFDLNDLNDLQINYIQEPNVTMSKK